MAKSAVGALPEIKSYKSALVVIPPAALPELALIEEIRRLHDKRFERWMPHITMVFPFFSSDYREKQADQQLQATLERILADHQRIQCSLDRFAWFKHGMNNYTLYLAPDAVSTVLLKQLVDQLASEIPEYDDVRRHGVFTPHLSLGQFRGEAEMRSLMEKYQSLVGQNTARFVIEGLSWVTRLGYRDRMALKQFYSFGP